MSKLHPGRRLSPLRLLLALLLIAGISAGSVFGVQKWMAERSTATFKPWFASYVDVTAKPTFAFEQMGTTTDNRNAMLSFVVSSSSNACTPAWGSVYTLDQAGESLDLDRRIARLQQQGGSIAVSFGGQLNDELATKCTDASKLKAAYKAVVDRYNVDTIDLDIEGTALADAESGARRAAVLAELQKERRDDGKNLAIWLTLPVTPQGLSETGTGAVAQLLAAGVDLAGVNALTMDYGQSRPDGQSMFDASKSALVQMHRQLGILYDQAGTHLNDATLWAKVGATPMIGQNDVASEVFTLEDAQKLNDFARSQGVGRMSMWSANRDVPCGSNYADLKIVSDSCSGIEQSSEDFAQALSKGFKASLTQSSGVVTTAEQNTEQTADDPATSPYQIWTEEGAYLQGTKVVWHHNVYQAKWWTQGDLPDNPVLQSWQTPWDLIGPVLPDDKPVAQATLPAGTYPEWAGEAVYDTGQRVMFQGTPYQAKWWTQGDSPAVATSNPNSSPWSPLTQEQINDILAQN